jgi:hypothetical protein
MPSGFRTAMTGFAAVLALTAGWIIAAEISRPSSGASAPARLTAAATAAHIGMFRGDLWAEAALAQGDLLRRDRQVAGGALEQARATTEEALHHAPHDARLWLLLASIYSRLDPASGRAAAAFRMSYYTGPHEIDLVPARLAALAGSQAVADGDLQQLARAEIKTALAHRPELKPAILAAHREALPAGKQFLETVLGEEDPALLASLRSSARLP